MHDKTHELATGDNYAVLTTLLKDGQPQSHVMWVDSDGEHILINTERHRQKYRNVERDPRVTVTILDAGSPYRFVEVRGRVVATVGGDEARAHIDHLSRKYQGHDYTNTVQSERVILKVLPDREFVRGF